MIFNGKMFISHSTKNLNIVDQLIALIKNVGIKSIDFFCSSRNGEGVESGNKINDRIIEGLRKARYIVYVITQDFLGSEYCMQELGMGCLRQKCQCYYLVAPDVELYQLNGFVNSKIQKFTFLNSENDLEEFLNSINKKDIPSSIRSNAIRTFLSATGHDHEALILNRKLMLEEQGRPQKEIQSLKDDISFQSEKYRNELKVLQDRISDILNDQQRKVLKGKLEIVRSLFLYLGAGIPISIRYIQQLEKNFWLGIAHEYETILDRLEEKDSRDYMAILRMQIYSTYGMLDKAMECALEAVEISECMYQYKLREFISVYKGSLVPLIDALKKKAEELTNSSEKDSTIEVIEILEKRELEIKRD